MAHGGTPGTETRLPRYTRAEWLSDTVVHVTGLSFVLMAVPVLIVLTAFHRGDLLSMTGVSVYGGALFAMIFCSALYNVSERFPWGATREWLFKRLDHSAIYLKIAGTYTPFTLLSGQGAWLTFTLWTAALTGVGLKLISPYRFRVLGLALYLGMGWAGVVAGQALLAALPWPVLGLMALGGGLYTFGVLFYLWDRLPYHNTIWHAFVLVASLAFYAAVLTFVLTA